MTERRSSATRKNAPPAPARNHRAVRTGAQADGANLPGFEVTRQEVQEAIAGVEWLRPSDLPLLDVFIREIHSYRHASDVLSRMPDGAFSRKLNAVKLVTRKARVLGELADRLGMTPMARAKLGLTVAQAEQVRVTPNRSRERTQAMAAFMKSIGAVPPAIEAEAVEDSHTQEEE